MNAPAKSRPALPCFEIDVELDIQFMGASQRISFSVCDNGESLVRLRDQIDEALDIARKRLLGE